MKIVIIERGSKLPAVKYGGTERVVWGLGYELNALGHDVTFIVPEGSICPFAKVITLDETVNINSLIPADTDIVHLNYVPKDQVEFPYIFTMHGNTQPEEILPLNSVFVSKNHAIRNNSDVFVYNGLLWEDYPKVDLTKKRNYLHFLAKASWKVKNLASSAKIAVKSNNKLEVMGGEKWTAYNLKRKPLFTLSPSVHYNGQVDNQQKLKIMQESKGLLFPVLWDEPFGLALIESLYCGCPVFGSERGSLPELITEDVGFLSNDDNELITAIKTKSFKPEVCHNYAKNNFSAKVMTENYLRLYEKVLAGEILNKTAPSPKLQTS